MNVSAYIRSVDEGIAYELMLLTGLAGLLGDGLLNGSAVRDLASLEGLCVSRISCLRSTENLVSESLELSVLGHEVSLATKAYHYGLVAGHVCTYSTFGGVAVSTLGCHELAFLTDDLLCALVVAFGLYESLLAVHHARTGHLTQLHYVSCFDFHFSSVLMVRDYSSVSASASALAPLRGRIFLPPATAAFSSPASGVSLSFSSFLSFNPSLTASQSLSRM